MQFEDVVIDFRDLSPQDVDLVGTAASETLQGTDFAEVIDGRAGDDTLIGYSDGDTYLFDVGYGQDVIIDRQVRVAWPNRDGSAVKEHDDVVRFGDDIPTASIAFAQDGDDLVVTVQDAVDTLRVRNQFRSIEDGIEWFAFADGTQWHISDVEEQLSIAGASWGDDVIEGVATSPNVLDGRQGDDQLIGGHFGDTYAFGAAYDLDQIIESTTPAPGATDRVVFSASVGAQRHSTPSRR